MKTSAINRKEASVLLFHRRLDLPDDPLRRGFVLPPKAARNYYHIFKAEEILNRKTIGRLRDIKLAIGTVALFYKRPGSLGIIHADVAWRDGKWRKNVAAINWNLSGADSEMRWYEIDRPGVEPDDAPAQPQEPWYYALNGIHYGYFGSPDRVNLPKRQVKILASAFIGSATLVRTDLPHTVENTDAEKGRWALSVRFEPDFKTWRQALATVKPLWKEPVM